MKCYKTTLFFKYERYKGSNMLEDQLDVSQEMLVEISRPLFYGFAFLTGASLLVSVNFAGTMMGLAVLSSIAFVSAGLAKELEDDWTRFLDVISVTSLLMVVLFASLTAARLSLIG